MTVLNEKTTNAHAKQNFTLSQLYLQCVTANVYICVHILTKYIEISIVFKLATNHANVWIKAKFTE